MPDDSIKREEIKALMEVQAKSTEQMVTIAERLRDIVEMQEKICDKLSNGMTKEIIDQISHKSDQCFSALLKEMEGVENRANEIKDGVLWLKILYGVLGIVIIIATVIIKFVTG